jgi:ABC-type Fe3+ transport system substrate-binding protein
VDQEPGFTRDRRQVAEAVVRGRYPIVCGLALSDLREFQAEGLGKNVKPLQLPEAETIVSGGGLFYFNRAPHPNAAKVFINWLLSKEGQTVWCQAQGWNSRRVDVPPSEPDLAPTPGVKYLNPQHESRMAAQDEVRIWIEQIAR